MALEISGKIIKVLPEQTGTGQKGAWKKQDFVIETIEQYPKKVCISAWGDKVDSLQIYSIGDEVKVSFNVESREYNEKWYTDIRVWKLEKGNDESPNGSADKFKKESVKQSKPEVDSFSSSSQEEDDLPF